MTRLTLHALVFVAASGLAFAQDRPPANPQQQPAPGGWRRVGDPPPLPLPAPGPEGQDPTQPVDRSDQFGQPIRDNQAQDNQAPPPAGQQPPRLNDRPSYARPAYGLPPELTLQPGTFVTIGTNQFLSSDRNQPGDTFSGTLAQPVVVDGVVVAPRGESIFGVVAEAQKARNGNSSRLALELTGITLSDGTQVPIRSQLVARQGSTTPVGNQVGTVAGTTAIGAAVGAAADWGRGAAIGAGVGAAAGVIGVLLTRNHPTEVYPEAPLTFRIETPVLISTVRAPQAFRYVGPDEYDRGYNTQLQPRPQPVAPPAPYYYGPAYYPYSPYYWGPSVSFMFGRGPGFYGRGGYRRWR